MHVHLFRLPTDSQHWYAQLYVDGKRYRFTCRTADKATAREYANQRAKKLADRHNRGLTGLPDPIRVSEVLDRYEREDLPKLRPSSQRRAGGIVAQARSWFVSGPLRDPQVAHVRPADVLAF